MRHSIVVIVVAALVACGGTGREPAPEAAAPAVRASGARAVAAPDGVAIAYTVAGSGSPALLFIHGWMCDQTHWVEQVGAFAPDHTVITIDLPGHGLSGMAREGWPFLAFGADVLAVFVEEDLSDVILVGHSMGGPVALEAARLAPERVRAVVGVDSLQNADTKWDPEEQAAFVNSMEADFSGRCDQFVAAMFPQGADSALVQRVRENMCSGPPEVGVALIRSSGDYDLAAALTAVEIPVRCINAPMWPTSAEANRKYHENFDAVIMDDVGHFLMLERPAEFNALLAEIIASL